MPFCSHCPRSCLLAHIRPRPATCPLVPALFSSVLFSVQNLRPPRGGGLNSTAWPCRAPALALLYLPAHLAELGLCFLDTGFLYGPVRVLLPIFHCFLPIESLPSKSNPRAAPCSEFQGLLCQRDFSPKPVALPLCLTLALSRTEFLMETLTSVGLRTLSYTSVCLPTDTRHSLLCHGGCAADISCVNQYGIAVQLSDLCRII